MQPDDYDFAFSQKLVLADYQAEARKDVLIALAKQAKRGKKLKAQSNEPTTGSKNNKSLAVKGV